MPQRKTNALFGVIWHVTLNVQLLPHLFCQGYKLKLQTDQVQNSCCGNGTFCKVNNKFILNEQVFIKQIIRGALKVIKLLYLFRSTFREAAVKSRG